MKRILIIESHYNNTSTLPSFYFKSERHKKVGMNAIYHKNHDEKSIENIEFDDEVGWLDGWKMRTNDEEWREEEEAIRTEL